MLKQNAFETENLTPIIFALYLLSFLYRAGNPQSEVETARSTHQPGELSDENVSNFQVMARILPVFLTLIPYWMVYFQVECIQKQPGPTSLLWFEALICLAGGTKKEQRVCIFPK